VPLLIAAQGGEPIERLDRIEQAEHLLVHRPGRGARLGMRGIDRTLVRDGEEPVRAREAAGREHGPGHQKYPEAAGADSRDHDGAPLVHATACDCRRRGAPRSGRRRITPSAPARARSI